MATEQLMSGGGSRYVQMKSSPPSSPPAAAAEEMSSVPSFRHSGAEANRIFEELPKASIVSVSRPDASDISPMQLSYTIQVQYKQVTCHLSLRKFGILNKKKEKFLWSQALKPILLTKSEGNWILMILYLNPIASSYTAFLYVHIFIRTYVCIWRIHRRRFTLNQSCMMQQRFCSLFVFSKRLQLS